MPRKKKSKLADKPVQKEEQSESDEGGESGNESESERNISDEVVQADFEAFPPSENDIGGIRSLLGQLLPKSSINMIELTEIIVKQSDIGCVHKVAHDEETEEDAMETDDDIYGVVTVVDISADEHECIRQFKSVLQKQFMETKKKGSNDGSAGNSNKIFEQLWNSTISGRVGWIINERLVNIPFQIAAPSFQSLIDDMGASNKNYEKFVALLKIHKLDGGGDGGASSSGGNTAEAGRAAGKKRKKMKNDRDTDLVVYSNPEEEILFEECDGYFDYCISGDVDGGVLGDGRGDEGSYKPYRRVVMLDTAALGKFLTKLKSTTAG